MARTVIEEQGPANGYVEDRNGPAVGLIVGLVLAGLVLLLAFLFLRDGDNTPAPSDGTNNDPGTSQSTEPTSEPSEPSTEPSAEATVTP